MEMRVKIRVFGGDVDAAVECAKDALKEELWREVWKECVDLPVDVVASEEGGNQYVTVVLHQQ